LFHKATQIQPNYAIAYNNLGNLLKELGEFQNAKINFISLQKGFGLEQIKNFKHKIMNK